MALMSVDETRVGSSVTGLAVTTLAACLALTACGQRDKGQQSVATNAGGSAAPAPVAAAPVDLAALHADAPDIDWFKGDVEAAFAAARAQSRPVFLYWGAQWCPPCKQLKSSVFSRSDFIAKSQAFVNVYLDGDLPSAQRWGDEFRVTGYPTVVIFRPDRTEVTRLSGGMDLSLYAAVLDDALGDVRPVKDVLDFAANKQEPISAGDCRRLAYHAFGLEDGEVFAPDLLAKGFESASLRCSAEQARERARLTVLAAARVTALETAALKAGQAPSSRLKVLIAKVTGLLADRELATANADAMRSLPPEFFGAARAGTPQLAGTLRERWMTVADAAATNPSFDAADQVSAQLLKIRAAKAFAPDGKVPTDVSRVALAAVTAALSEKREAYARAGVVNSSINVFLALDELTRARDLLAAEAAASSHPHYYIGDLADVEEKLGNTPRAVELLADAYTKAKGPASRFQWGHNYLSGLLRMRAEDAATIRRVGTDVLGELAQPNSVHRRTKARLGELQKSLGAWATTAERKAVVAQMRERFGAACVASEQDGGERVACQQVWTL